MANITAADVNKLRKATGAGMMDCKKALVEADGDFDKAIEILRKKGQKVAAKRADRDATEGAVIAITSDDNTQGVVVRVSCETDFVAKNEGFVNFAQSVAKVALDSGVDSIDALKAASFDDKLTVADKLTEQTGVIGEKVDVSGFEKIIRHKRFFFQKGKTCQRRNFDQITSSIRYFIPLKNHFI